MNKSSKQLVIIAGGGSGGHVYPALAIADGLVDAGIPNKSIVFYGSKRTLENEIVPASNYKLVTFGGRGLNKREYFRNIFNSIGLLFACLKAIFLFVRKRPSVVIGVGGYASVPAIVAGTLLRVPCVVHEQNAYLGRTNKIAQKLGAKILVTFEYTQGATKDSLLVGLPMRSNIEKMLDVRTEYVDTDHEKPTVVISGGSLGSVAINEATIEMLKEFQSKIEFLVVHICGTNHYKQVKSRYEELGLSQYAILHSYRDDIQTIYARSDCVISRAGAGTCVELLTLGINCVLVPLPSAPGDHQRRNAKSLVDSGQCIILDQADLNGETLFGSIRTSLNKNQEVPTNNYHLDSRRRIADYILELIGKKNV